MSGWLFDTNVVVRSVLRSERLPAEIKSGAGDVRRVVSVVSAFEIGVKNSIGKLPLPRAFERDFMGTFGTVVDDLSADLLEVRLTHAVRVAALPLHHRDPFDRLLICQALEEDLTIVSADRKFAAYEGLKVLSV